MGTDFCHYSHFRNLWSVVHAVAAIASAGGVRHELGGSSNRLCISSYVGKPAFRMPKGARACLIMSLKSTFAKMLQVESYRELTFWSTNYGQSIGTVGGKPKGFQRLTSHSLCENTALALSVTMKYLTLRMRADCVVGLWGYVGARCGNSSLVSQ